MSGDLTLTLLAKDPNWLYVYWDISEEKSRAFMSELGEELWRRSVPSLKVTDITRNESFFVRINEFSDNWYIYVQYPNNLYVVEIGRKLSENYFIGMQSSNSAVTPANHASPYTVPYFANYTDVKNGRFEIHTGKSVDSGIYGISSAELYGMYGQEPPGVSSDSFMKG